MNEKKIRKLIKLVEESEIESLEVSSWGRSVKITQRLSSNSNGHSNGSPVIDSRTYQPAPLTPPPAQSTAQPAPVQSKEESVDSNLVVIKSPMVGTFYASPSPDAGPYVSLNEKISKGQVVCIVEAMKLMNEIEAEVSGRVTKILVENGTPVEFGQELYLIDTSA